MSNDPRLDQLLDIEAIKVLKSKYFRLLDTKQYDELLELFADDASTAYDNGRHAYQGKEAIREFFLTSMAKPDFYHHHHGHHPEVTLTSDTTATGHWGFEDTVIAKEFGVLIQGAGIYCDEFVKQNGEWKFQHTGYERLWCTTEPLSDSMIEVRGMFDDAERKMSAERDKRPFAAAYFGGLKTYW